LTKLFVDDSDSIRSLLEAAKNYIEDVGKARRMNSVALEVRNTTCHEGVLANWASNAEYCFNEASLYSARYAAGC
jgi:hypothetical protein